MSTKTQKTKKPTGLGIARKGLKFTFTWKIGDSDYGEGQDFEYRICVNKKWGNWKSKSISKTTTSVSESISSGSYYPNTSKKVTKIEFRVRGKRKNYKNGKTEYNPTMSDWSKKTFDINKPQKPSLSQALDDTNMNATTFSCETDVSDSDSHHFSKVQWMSVLVKDMTGRNDEQNGFKDYDYTGANASKKITEDSSLLADKSYSRVIKCRSMGIAGVSDWTYICHTYATPYKAKNVNGTCTDNKSSCHITAKWDIQSDSGHPIDSMDVQWLVDTPTEKMGCPSGASWNTASTIARIDGSCADAFNIDTSINEEECMWIRVLCNHDKNISYSEARRIFTGKLKKPSIGQCSSLSQTQIEVNADNNSSISSSFIAVYIKTSEKAWEAVGIIPHGTTQGTFYVPTIPEGVSYQIGAKAIIGSYTEKDMGSYKTYIFSEDMSSELVYTENLQLPVAPDSIAVEKYNDSTVILSWRWAWTLADAVTISWAENYDAWESTEEPEEFNIDKHVTSWHIGGLEEGKTYYFRVKLRKIESDGEIESDWSEIVPFAIISEVAAQPIGISSSSIAIEDCISCICSYDGTGDISYQIAEEINGIVQEDAILANSQNASFDISISDINAIYSQKGLPVWEPGSKHYLSCRVVKIGYTSEWSESSPVVIKPECKIEIIDNNLESISISDDEEEGTTRTVTALSDLPITATVTGASEEGKTTVLIERSDDYLIARPTEMEERRFAGEIIGAISIDGEGTVTIDHDDLIGDMDDGAWYNLVCRIEDAYGNSDENKIPFLVKWGHQPEVPTASVEIEGMIAKITVNEPISYQDGDTFDLYRLSADVPELIVRDGLYGATYVDPYPAFGEDCGHRIVNKNKNGDYITSDNTIAWIDLKHDDGDIVKCRNAIIEFEEEVIELKYNISLNNTWAKDFKRTSYLGGSVEGDWNQAITRDLSVDAVHVKGSDDGMIHKMRMLAYYPGICHIRTPEGSSFACDIQVKETQSHDSNYVNFNLTVSKVDTESLDGITLEKWEANTNAVG